MKKTKYSIFFIISVSIVTIISLAMLVQSVIIYNTTKEKLTSEIIYKTNISMEQLKKVLVHYIETFEVNEYEKVIESEMGYKDIYSIVVEDYNMGKILGQEKFIVGKIRDENWNVKEYHLEKIPSDKIFYSQKHEIVNDQGVVMGTLSITSSDELMKIELENIIKRNLLLTFSISFIMVVLLFYVIYISILKPLTQISTALSNTDKDGIPKTAIRLHTSSKEVTNLAMIINSMILRIKKSTKALEVQNVEFQTIFNNSKDGIAILDLDTNFLKFNNAYLEITGYTKEELKTKSCIGLTATEDKEAAIKAVETVKEIGFIENFEKSCIGKDGREIASIMSIVLLPDNKRMLVTTKDMTQIKLLESQSKLASMGEMIGNIAHQWRQPLSVITTSVSGLKIKKDLGKEISKEEMDEISDVIVKQAKYLSKTIDDFRDFIKGDRNYLDVSIKDSINESLSLVTSSITNNYINLVTDINDDLVINGNKNELEQAFINIINNSKDALKDNIEIEDDRFIFISTKKINDDSLEVSIKDTAGGIKETIIDRIFEPYFTTKHKSQGTGLGLSMVDKILRERHNGSIRVLNEEFIYKDKHYRGASFIIVFKKA